MPQESTTTNTTVAVVTTGGTIGSVLSDSVREVDTSGETIADRVSDHCDKLNVELEVVPAVNMLSENMEPADWAEVGKSINECLDDGYDNIVVTHGTDTLVYSVNAFRNALSDISGRVVFTGSFYGPDEPESDVELSLRSSLEASIDPSLPDDVYVCFRSPETDERALLHRAVDTKPMSMDDMGFRSLFDAVVGEFSFDTGWNWSLPESPTDEFEQSGLGGIPSKSDYTTVIGDVQLTKAVPGQIQRTDLDSEASPDVLIVDLYHSGTASLSTHSNSLREFIQTHKNDTDILLVGMSNNVVSPPYDSTAKLVADGAELIQDVQPHVVYTGMYAGLANGLSTDEILDRIPGSTLSEQDKEQIINDVA